jgi:hypothetical protein
MSAGWLASRRNDREREADHGPLHKSRLSEQRRWTQFGRCLIDDFAADDVGCL